MNGLLALLYLLISLLFGANDQQQNNDDCISSGHNDFPVFDYCTNEEG